MNKNDVLKAEAEGASLGWVAPLTVEDREYFAYLRSVFKRYKTLHPLVQPAWNMIL